MKYFIQFHRIVNNKMGKVKDEAIEEERGARGDRCRKRQAKEGKRGKRNMYE